MHVRRRARRPAGRLQERWEGGVLAGAGWGAEASVLPSHRPPTPSAADREARRLQSSSLQADWCQNLRDAGGAGEGRLETRVRRATLERGLPRAPTRLDHRVQGRRAPRSGGSAESRVRYTGLRLANTQPEVKLLYYQTATQSVNPQTGALHWWWAEQRTGGCDEGRR